MNAGEATPNEVRARAIYWLYRKQNLLAPVNTMMELAEILRQDPVIQGRPEVEKDLEMIRVSARTLKERVENFLDPGRVDRDVEFILKVDHDLRAPLSIIFNYGDYLLEKAGPLGLEPVASELGLFRQLGRRSLELIDEIVFHLMRTTAESEPGARDAVPDSLLEPFRELAKAFNPPEGGRRRTAPGRILVVEDHPDARWLLCEQLETQGHEVVAVDAGAAALERFDAEVFDLVLLDIMLPHVNGLEVLKRIKEHDVRGHVPVLVISSFSDEDKLIRCIEAGAEDYLVKPFNPTFLWTRVDTCLEKRYLRRCNEEILHAILPPQVARTVIKERTYAPQPFPWVAVMFADVSGLTTYTDMHRDQPEAVVNALGEIFVAWEQIAEKHEVQKIKTIGDEMLAVANLLQPVTNPVQNCIECGLEMIGETRRLAGSRGWTLKVGIHVGPVVAGIIGAKQYLFDLWGDTVNTASRMQSNGAPGVITLSETAWSQLSSFDPGDVVQRTIPIKGKGMMPVVHYPAILNEQYDPDDSSKGPPVWPK